MEHIAIPKGTGRKFLVKGFQQLPKSRIGLPKRLRQVLAVGAAALLQQKEFFYPGRQRPGPHRLRRTAEMHKEYLTQGFLQRLGDNTIINSFLIRALSEDADHDQYLLFRQRKDNPIHFNIQNILCEYYDPPLCSDQVIDAGIILLYCDILRYYQNHAFSIDHVMVLFGRQYHGPQWVILGISPLKCLPASFGAI